MSQQLIHQEKIRLIHRPAKQPLSCGNHYFHSYCLIIECYQDPGGGLIGNTIERSIKLKGSSRRRSWENGKLFEFSTVARRASRHTCHTHIRRRFSQQRLDRAESIPFEPLGFESHQDLTPHSRTRTCSGVVCNGFVHILLCCRLNQCGRTLCYARREATGNVLTADGWASDAETGHRVGNTAQSTTLHSDDHRRRCHLARVAVVGH